MHFHWNFIKALFCSSSVFGSSSWVSVNLSSSIWQAILFSSWNSPFSLWYHNHKNGGGYLSGFPWLRIVIFAPNKDVGSRSSGLGVSWWLNQLQNMGVFFGVSPFQWRSMRCCWCITNRLLEISDNANVLKRWQITNAKAEFALKKFITVDCSNVSWVADLLVILTSFIGCLINRLCPACNFWRMSWPIQLKVFYLFHIFLEDKKNFVQKLHS